MGGYLPANRPFSGDDGATDESHPVTPRARTIRAARRVGVAMALALAAWGAPMLHAQQPPVPSEPVYRDRGPPPPGAGGRGSAQQERCARLEQQLATDWLHGQQEQGRGPQLEQEMQRVDRTYQQAQAQAEREGCYESVFIFGRALRRTPRCLQIHGQIEDSRRQLALLQEQRQATRRGGTRVRQDDLIRELARHGCGETYSREARRRGGGGGFFGWFGDRPNFEEGRRRRDTQTSRIVPFATYRTMCVRTCDGYYFPVSFSTLPNGFANDATQCQSRCAAPTELYVYRNPGEDPEQMISADGTSAYNDLPNAWRHRKEFVEGCSCNVAEYDPEQANSAPDRAGTDAAPGTGGFETITRSATPDEPRTRQ